MNVGLSDSLVTSLAWLVPWGMSVTLVGDTPEEVAEAQRQLVRIGIDRPAAAAADGGPHVLNVRRDDERRNRSIAGRSTCRSTS